MPINCLRGAAPIPLFGIEQPRSLVVITIKSPTPESERQFMTSGIYVKYIYCVSLKNMLYVYMFLFFKLPTQYTHEVALCWGHTRPTTVNSCTSILDSQFFNDVFHLIVLRRLFWELVGF